VAKNVKKDAGKKPVKDIAKKPVKDAGKKPVPEPVQDVTDDISRNESADPVDEGFKLIQSKPEGILQSELWKELGVDSRKCSRIVKKLEESGLIDREEFKRDGIKTYLLRAKRQPVNPGHLLAGDELIPCISCELECVVEECHPLMDWMYQLAIVEHTEE
jgi:Lrp/AsnC family transcriptional regulator, leucine-responsive regulatory protein